MVKPQGIPISIVTGPSFPGKHRGIKPHLLVRRSGTRRRIKSLEIVATGLEKVLEGIEAICPVLSMLDKEVKTKINFKLNE